MSHRAARAAELRHRLQQHRHTAADTAALRHPISGHGRPPLRGVCPCGAAAVNHSETPLTDKWAGERNMLTSRGCEASSRQENNKNPVPVLVKEPATVLAVEEGILPMLVRARHNDARTRPNVTCQA